MVPHFDSRPASSSSPDSFSRPRPRPPWTAAQSAQIRAQNRRRAYLDRHGSYFQSSEHELADPLLYDFLIRRFQTPVEREAEARAKGYARVLEGSLLRGEERLARLRGRTRVAAGAGAGGGVAEGEGEGEGDGDYGGGDGDGDGAVAGGGVRMVMGAGMRSGDGGGGGVDDGGSAASGICNGGGPSSSSGIGETGTTFSSLSAELAPPPRTRAEGRAQWDEFLRDRFIRGEDEDFDYAVVDENDEYDVLERAEQQEAWFEEEDPGWASDDGNGGLAEGGRVGDVAAERVLTGETGIQDF